jgi:hypothetical protein
MNKQACQMCGFRPDEHAARGLVEGYCFDCARERRVAWDRYAAQLLSHAALDTIITNICEDADNVLIERDRRFAKESK